MFNQNLQSTNGMENVTRASSSSKSNSSRLLYDTPESTRSTSQVNMSRNQPQLSEHGSSNLQSQQSSLQTSSEAGSADLANLATPGFEHVTKRRPQRRPGYEEVEQTLDEEDNNPENKEMEPNATVIPGAIRKMTSTPKTGRKSRPPNMASNLGSPISPSSNTPAQIANSSSDTSNDNSSLRERFRRIFTGPGARKKANQDAEDRRNKVPAPSTGQRAPSSRQAAKQAIQNLKDTRKGWMTRN